MKIFAFTSLLIILALSDSFSQPSEVLLKNYRPQSIYKIPVTKPGNALYPAIDMHAHPYGKNNEEVAEWVATMNQSNIKKTILLVSAAGEKFDSVNKLYAPYSAHFDLWCGLDLNNIESPDWSARAVKELERCYRLGAKGVGELIDIGQGIENTNSNTSIGSTGIHFDDPKLNPVFEACARLKLPVNLHVAESAWMYEKMDSTNDGLMNAYHYRVDDKTNIIDHAGMILVLEKTLKRHPKTTFIACHFANCCYNLDAVGRLLDLYPNLYVDIAARFFETAAIPRFASKFYQKYQDRLLYGTDMGMKKEMYDITFRILETEDEHFYNSYSSYHWYINGFGLSKKILQKLYFKNAEKIIGVQK